MTVKRDVRVVRDVAIVKWLHKQKQWVADCQHMKDIQDGQIWKVIDETMSESHNHVIMPIAVRWDAEEAESFMSLLRRKGYQRVYAIGILYQEDLCLSIPVDADHMYGLLFRLTDYGIIAPLDLSFCILHTPYDYWIISGEMSLVEELARSDLEAGMRRFEDEAEDGLVWEPGPHFSKAIAARYKAYNRKMTGR